VQQIPVHSVQEAVQATHSGWMWTTPECHFSHLALNEQPHSVQRLPAAAFGAESLDSLQCIEALQMQPVTHKNQNSEQQLYDISLTYCYVFKLHCLLRSNFFGENKNLYSVMILLHYVSKKCFEETLT